MHELFTKVLSKRDLSRAGDLFTVSDSEIVNDLTEVLTEIEPIISQPDYLKNTNDQSVVEICVTRVLSCIRETKTAERYCSALVGLLETCLNYNLEPTGAGRDDPPHAKISADIISSIFLNYDKKEVMKIALPVAVKFLSKGNKELSTNLASYLSLAAIDYAYLLSPHVDPILESIIAGNYGLCRVLSQLYEVSPDELAPHAALLVSLVSRCDSQEKLSLLQLFTLIAQKKPTVLESSIPQLCEFLSDTTTAPATMSVLLRLAENRPNLIANYFDQIKAAAEETPTTVSLAAQILATSGKSSKSSSTQVNVNNNGNKTSGGVTIVKLNSSSTSPITAPSATTPPIATVTQNHVGAQLNGTTSISPTGGHVLTIHTSTITSPNTNNAINSHTGAPVVPPTPPHTGYTRRAKLGDSRSTGRLHPSSNTHRSMTRLNIAGGSVGGLHKSMTRLSSSQQINQNGSNSNNVNSHSSGNVAQQAATLGSPSSPTYVTPVPPLSSNVIITGHNKWGIPSTKITSGGVTVTTSPTKIRPHSQGPITLLGSTGALGKYSTDALNQSTGSIALQQNSVSVHHASPASPPLQNNATTQKSVMTLPINSTNTIENEVVVSGPTTVTSRRNDNTSVTLLNANNSIINQRMSTFEPYQIMRDPVQQFCEKNFQSIKKYMDQISQYLPPPTRCGIEERRTKKVAKLHFACQVRGPHCLYSKTCFTMRTRNPRTWIHLMFLDFQVRNYVKEKCVLSTREPGISNLKNIWQILKCENRTFTELVTSHFPSQKDREILVNELRHSGFLDVFEVIKTDQTKPNANELEFQWGCFLCNHPDKAVGFLRGNNQPMIEGQLKEKKGKWRLFRRWRTRYFTLSGAHLSCKGSSGGESIDVNQIRSVKVSRGARNIPKAFEIFTGDQTLILKPKDGKNAEEWVQCLSIAVAHSQARDNPTAKTNSLPARGLGNSRTAF